MRLILCIFFIMTLFSQERIDVYTFDRSNSFTIFEIALIENCVQMYNNRFKTEVKVVFHEVKTFKEGFDIIRSRKASESPALYLNKISYTDERQKLYDFSPPYMFNTFALLGKKNKTYTATSFESGKHYGNVRGTIFYDILTNQQKKSQFKISQFENSTIASNAVKSGKIDYFLTDYVDSWIYDLQNVFFIDNPIQDKFCVLLPKNGHKAFKEKFNGILAYYVKSQKYYKLIKDSFGKDALTYFKNSQLKRK